MEKKTAEEVLRKVFGELRTDLMLATTKAELIRAMEEYSSLQSEEKDKEIERLREALQELWSHTKLNNEDAARGAYHKDSVFGKVEQALSNQPIESDKAGNGDYIFITVNPKGGEDCNLTYIVEAYQDETKAKESIKDFPHCYVASTWLHYGSSSKDRRIKELEEALKESSELLMEVTRTSFSNGNRIRESVANSIKKLHEKIHN